MLARSALALGCLCALVACAAANGASGGGTGLNRDTTYTSLEPLKGQWAISIEATKTADKTVFEPQICDVPAASAPCNHPLLTADAHDKVRITAKLLKAPLKTAGDLPPSSVVLRLCFSKPFVADRPWRKPNDVIDKDRACPQTLATYPVDANNTYTAVWPVPKGAPKATWYAQVMVECTNGTSLSYCQEDSTKGKNFVGTQIISSTPVTLKIAAAVCSAIAPAFMALFFIKERVMKKTT